MNQNINNIYSYDKHISFSLHNVPCMIIFPANRGLKSKKKILYLCFRLCVHTEAYSLAVLKYYTGYNTICLYNNFIELWSHHIGSILQPCQWKTENWNKMGSQFSFNIYHFIPLSFTSSVPFMPLSRSLLSLWIIYTVR